MLRIRILSSSSEGGLPRPPNDEGSPVLVLLLDSIGAPGERCSRLRALTGGSGLSSSPENLGVYLVVALEGADMLSSTGVTFLVWAISSKASSSQMLGSS